MLLEWIEEAHATIVGVVVYHITGTFSRSEVWADWSQPVGKFKLANLNLADGLCAG